MLCNLASRAHLFGVGLLLITVVLTKTVVFDDDYSVQPIHLRHGRRATVIRSGLSNVDRVRCFTVT